MHKYARQVTVYMHTSRFVSLLSRKSAFSCHFKVVLITKLVFRIGTDCRPKSVQCATSGATHISSFASLSLSLCSCQTYPCCLVTAHCCAAEPDANSLSTLRYAKLEMIACCQHIFNCNTKLILESLTLYYLAYM